MNAFRHSAVLAALCLVYLALHADATPVGNLLVCSITVPTASTQNYNNWTQLCCPTGVKNIASGNDPLVGCCHDNTGASCPSLLNTGLPAANQSACCRPDPLVTVAADQVERNCYIPTFQGCCKAQYRRLNGAGTAYEVVGSVATYDSELWQCCSATSSQPVQDTSTSLEGNGAEKLLVPKAAASCIQYLRKQSPPISIRCLTDSMCPGNAIGRGKCCRRAQNTPLLETTLEYETNGWGRCYDPKFEDCCEGRFGNTTHSNTTFSATVIDRTQYQCCKLHTNAAGAGQYFVPVGNRCPCTIDSDCPNGNYTCCAPTQAELDTGSLYSRRLISCGAGPPTQQVSPWNDVNSYPTYQGCYGQCIPSGSYATSNIKAAVCLSQIPNFATKCDNLRIVDGYNWVPPVAANLIYNSEAELHGKDCCPVELGFNALFDTQSQLCCPVMGTARPNGGLTRRLSPIVDRAALTTTNYAQLDACLCNDDSHCQAGYKCCPNANAALFATSGVGGANHRLIYARPDGTVFNGLCIDPNTTACCNTESTNPSATAAPSPLAVSAVTYNPNAGVCCVAGPAPGYSGQVQDNIQKCGCHVDADCPGEYSACCTSSQKFGSAATHAFGVCYDRRRHSCCNYHTPSTAIPLSNVAAESDLNKFQVYDNTSFVCCPWGGPKASAAECTCRSDLAATDCPGTWKCCSGDRVSLQGNTPLRNYGVCYDPAKSQGCCSYFLRPDNAVAIYDTRKKVCCAVNGVQNDHRSCACSSDLHCPANGQCCLDAEATAAGVKVDCSDSLSTSPPYTNCPGRCIHKEIETCCDNPFTSEWADATSVRACVSAYQKCCDGQCCNKAVQTCKKTTLNRNSGGTLTVSISGTGYHYGLDQEIKKCTSIEHASPSIVFHTWVFPAFLSLACIVVLLAGSRAGLGADFGSNIQRLVLVGVQVFVGIMSILLLWSPLWKYGFGIVFANAFILNSFVVGGTYTRRLAAVIIIVCFLWIYEPFGQNSILTFGTRTFGMDQDGGYFQVHGLNYHARLLTRWRDNTGLSAAYSDACVEHYMYWIADQELYDTREWNPLTQTRGICRRSWMHTITVLAGLITPFQTVWLFLAGIALARASSATKDVKVQPIQA